MTLDLTILTGFLGSGKTTLLREWLALPEAAGTAVIVNEVGDIGLDGAILAEGSGGLRMAMLANGCVCCALGGELAGTIEDLLASTDTPPSRIVLETSGLSKPGPILRSLQSLAGLRLRVSVLATFDCVRGTDVTGFEEAAAQWAGAGAILLTRRDLATPALIETAAATAASLNPVAVIIDQPDHAAALRAAFLPRPPAHGLPEPAAQAHPRISTFLARPSAALAWDDLAAWLDNLAGLLGERLLRIKGLLAVEGEDHPILVQSVGTLFSAPRPFPGPAAPFLVIIARDTALRELSGLLPALPIVLTGASPFSPPPSRLRAR